MDWIVVSDFEHSEIAVSTDFTQISGNTTSAKVCGLRRNNDAGTWEYECPTRGWRRCAFSPLIERALVQRRGMVQ